MVKALDRKLLRDLGHMTGQVITIALVVACGIASYVAINGTYYSLLGERDSYYEHYRFPDVFATLERAPKSLERRIEAIDGIARAQTRVVEQISVPIESMAEPATAELISLPAGEPPVLGGVALREGRMFEPGRADEAVVLEAFALGHHLHVGSRLPAVIAGIRRELRIVGIAQSPEFVFSISPGEMSPDPRRFGVLWMDEDVVRAAFVMEGAWNDLLVRLQPGASEPAVVSALDRLLEPYGCRGAHGRDKQISNNVLRGELAQLQTLTALLPTIFLCVAAFLINVVLSRLVQLQRSQIATLKAVGYGRFAVGLHYLKLVSVVVVSGAIVGVGVGAWLGGHLTQLYTRYFHFPSLHFALEPRVLTVALGSSLLAAVVGALSAVRAVMRLPPAEAMRPEAPASYKRGLSTKLGVPLFFGQAAEMVMREIERKPVRALLSSLGIAMSVAVLVAGRFGTDAVQWYMQVQFELSQREDIDVSFRRAVRPSALGELAHLPGVRKVEPLRLVPVRYRAGHHQRESVLMGHPGAATLRRVLDQQGRLATPPEQGVLLTTTLAKILHVGVGDKVTIEVLEGQRGIHEVPVSGLVDEVFGLFGHMQLDAVERLLGSEPRISMALLSIDPEQRDRLERLLKRRPEVLGVNRLDNLIQMFREQTAGQMRFTTLILTIFAAVIACGVIYNNARIALSTRGRDLASLRVLGFRKSEISAILLGELAIQVLVALVPGMLLGGLISRQMMANADPEMYRFPVVISAQTYAFATVVTLVASLASALVVRNRLDHLDLIGVLKSRE
ncbi:MAG: ABC transporter permease [Polyangiales bacterium]